MRCRRPPGRVRKRGGGGAARLQRPERRWGQRESSGVSDSAGRGGGGGAAHPGREVGSCRPRCWQKRRGRREAPDGLRAPPAGCGGSRSQSGARAQTSGRQRTPASGPQGPRGAGERGRPAGGGAGLGAGPGAPPSRALGHVGRDSCPAQAPASRFLPGGRPWGRGRFAGMRGIEVLRVQSGDLGENGGQGQR